MDKLPKWSSYALVVFRVVVGYVFLQPGMEKLWGFQGGRIDHNFGTLHGFAGLLEVPGAILLILGLFTRPTAFILSGEMCVAYFRSWAPRGFWPITNSGEMCVILSFAFLWLVAAGAGPWSLDHLIQSRLKSVSGLRATVASWEGYVRSILRVILAFTFSLHGYRLMFGLFATPAGRLTRQQRIGVAIDSLPHVVGLIIIIGGVLLFLGLFTRLTALILSIGPAIAYVTVAAPRGPWSINNGGQETILYLFLFLYFAAAGAGDWSLDSVLQRKRTVGAEFEPASAAATT
jgi:putative oxidoreductase